MNCPHPAFDDSAGPAKRRRRECTECGYRVTCLHCNDTHIMDLEDRSVMCTHCPIPCKTCRRAGNGPYCATTPCACSCHDKKAYGPGMWSGLCLERKHGLDYEGQQCDLCLSKKQRTLWPTWLAGWLRAQGMVEEDLIQKWAGTAGEAACKRAFAEWMEELP